MAMVLAAIGGPSTVDGAPACAGGSCWSHLQVSPQRAVATVRSPAVVTIELPVEKGRTEECLELAVRVVRSDSARKFIVTASGIGGGAPKTIGQLAFYPPAQEGKTYWFRIEVPKRKGYQSPRSLKLRVALVPLSAAKPTSKGAVEVTSARFR